MATSTFFLAALIKLDSEPDFVRKTPPPVFREIVEEKPEPEVEPQPEPEQTQPEPQPPSMAQRLLDLHNAQRSRPLELDADLMAFAQQWANNMASRRSMYHSDLGFPGQWWMRGENVAAGQRNEEEVVGDWMNSPGHRANILNGQFTHVGFGRSGNYWCVCFGQKTEGHRFYTVTFWRWVYFKID